MSETATWQPSASIPNLLKRAAIMAEIRRFFADRGVLEVETPCMSQATVTDIHLVPFETRFVGPGHSQGMNLYLMTSPEYHMKRLLAAGCGPVYQLCRSFRNEEMGRHHNPEFTMIELYEAYADYNDMMVIMENMVAYACEKVNGTTKVVYEGKEIDLTPPWRRATMVDLVKEYAGVDFDTIATHEEARAIAKEKHLEFKKDINDCTKGDILNAMFEEYAEEHLIQPTFVCDYPVEISPLTKKKRGKEEYTERFEGFIYGREVCNAYSELNDPIVQRERFEQQAKERELGDDEAYVIDEDFMSALETGMPPTGGLGMGVDRIVMFLTNSSSIRDVILFPTMKPL